MCSRFVAVSVHTRRCVLNNKNITFIYYARMLSGTWAGDKTALNTRSLPFSILLSLLLVTFTHNSRWRQNDIRVGLYRTEREREREGEREWKNYWMSCYTACFARSKVTWSTWMDLDNSFFSMKIEGYEIHA